MLIFTLLLLIPISVIYPQDTINVPGDYTTIQAAIDAANSGDIVLVEDGIYFENINFDGKAITVASHFLIDGDTNHILNTVIDGDSNGTVVIFHNGEDSTTILNGFTVTNGSGGCGMWGRHGGGITCINSDPTLSNLRITDNTSCVGGGIYLSGSNPRLINLNIFNNRASEGGGVYVGNGFGPYPIPDSHPRFDNVNRCNIFLNYASQGSDFYSGNDSSNINVPLDTFSVVIPTNYHAFPTNSFTFDINHAKVVQSNSDLYVNPNGSNNNSGLSWNDPLKTISYAHTKILADSLNPHKIYLADGKYTDELNDGKYSIGLVDYITIYGETRSGVIFSSEIFGDVFSASSIKNTSLENLTIIGDGNDTRGIYCYNSSPIIKNVTLCGAMIWLSDSNPYIEKVKISGNMEEAGILMYGSSPTLMNVEITDNSGWLVGGLRCEENSHAKLINCTFSRNQSLNFESGGIHINHESSLKVVNSILWEDGQYEIGVNHGGPFPNVCIIVTNSLIKGGIAGIHHFNGGGTVFWLDGNINFDPMFIDPNNADYRLQAGSLCIDAGIQDTTIIYNNRQDTLIVPPLNFVGSAPDMGAYEFDPTTVIQQQLTGIVLDFILAQNYPNPFNPTTAIKYQIPELSFVTLKVYDVLGSEVVTLVNEEKPVGSYDVELNAKGLTSGIYFYKLQAGSFVETKKMVLLK